MGSGRERTRSRQLCFQIKGKLKAPWSTSVPIFILFESERAHLPERYLIKTGGNQGGRQCMRVAPFHLVLMDILGVSHQKKRDGNADIQDALLCFDSQEKEFVCKLSSREHGEREAVCNCQFSEWSPCLLPFGDVIGKLERRHQRKQLFFGVRCVTSYLANVFPSPQLAKLVTASSVSGL